MKTSSARRAIPLKPPFELQFQPHNRGLLLTVFRNGEPYVCRKATRKELVEFVHGKTPTAFKGRLQLIGQKRTVKVQVKNEIIGSVPRNLLKSEVEKFLEP